MRCVLIIALLVCCGCTQVQMLPYLDQVMVLQDFGADKKAQEELIGKIDAGFDRMQKTIADGTITRYKSEKDIIKAFGPPIVSEQEVVDGKTYMKALYRYAIQNKGPHKAHIFYDKRGLIVKMESL